MTTDTAYPVPGTTRRSFWTYWAASATSSLGTAAGAVALPLVGVLVLQATALEMGLIAAAGYAAWLVIGLPAGVITQRLPLRAVQVGMDLVRALAVVSVPLAWWAGHLTVAQLVVVALVVSLADVLFDVANSTFLPSIVPADRLNDRNSFMSGTFSVTQLGGPALGGLAVQVVGAVPTLLVDAVSYLVSAALLRTLPRRTGERRDAWPPVREMVHEGWRYVVRHPVMAPCMWDATVVNAVCGAQLALYPLYLVRELGAPPGVVGFLLAAEGIGSLVGAALTPRLVRRLGSARAVLLAAVVSPLGALLVPLGAGVAGMAVFAAGNVLFALTVVVTSIVTRTYRQTASPPELYPRVMATVRFVSWGAIPVGGVLAGALATWVGPRWALVLFAVVSLASPIVLLCSPVRSLRDLTDARAGSGAPGRQGA